MRLSPEELLKRCNEFRKAGGAEEISKLEPGIAGIGDKCLIARNLNFKCRITFNLNIGVIESEDGRLVQVAEALGLEPAANTWPPKHRYLLPADLIESAREFDLGNYSSVFYIGPGRVTGA